MKRSTCKKRRVLLDALVKGINSPVCSSIGRLFDGIAALLGCCLISNFEGEAAMALEALAYSAKGGTVNYQIPLLHERGLWLMDWRPMVMQIMEDRRKGAAASEIALAFHEALAEAIAALATKAGEEKVLLSGGVMQNKLLVEKAMDQLKREGFNPYCHRRIPPNDGGLAVGQIVGKLYCNGEINVPCSAR